LPQRIRGSIEVAVSRAKENQAGMIRQSWTPRRAETHQRMMLLGWVVVRPAKILQIFLWETTRRARLKTDCRASDSGKEKAK
jgi:hypothetical protein